jgi:hypothetical protein
MLSQLAVLAFIAEMTRLPGHSAARLGPVKTTAHTIPSRFTDCFPLLIAESAVRVLTFFGCGGERGFQLAVVGDSKEEALVPLWVEAK